MSKRNTRGNTLSLVFIACILVFLIVCPLIMIFAKAVVHDGRLDFFYLWRTISESKNAKMIASSLLLGL